MVIEPEITLCSCNKHVICYAGFMNGTDSLTVTSGVLSRIEVVEYSHSAQQLLALQVRHIMSIACIISETLTSR